MEQAQPKIEDTTIINPQTANAEETRQSERKLFRTIINDKEIKNPLVNFFIALSAILLIICGLVFMFSVIVPLLGTLLSFVLTILGIMLAAVVIGLILLVFGSPLLALILLPFVILAKAIKSNNDPVDDLPAVNTPVAVV